MQTLRSAQLPVLDGHWPIGILFAGEVAVARDSALVGDAMSTAIYITSVDAKVRDATRILVDEGYDAALIYDGERLVGTFTAADALRSLVVAVPDRRVRTAA